MEIGKSLKFIDELCFGLLIVATGLVIAFKFTSSLLLVEFGICVYAVTFLSFAIFNILKLIMIKKQKNEQFSKKELIFTAIKIILCFAVLGLIIIILLQF